MRIVCASDPAALVARVFRAGKQPASNFDALLIPADLSRRPTYGPQLFCATGGEAFCRVSAPPGEIFTDPEPELRRRATPATRVVSLRAGEEKTIETFVKEQ